MKENFARSLEATLKHEGGFSDHPNDAGGKTMWGVTKARYDGYRRLKGLPLRPVRQIQRHEAEEIYRLYYWDKIEGDLLPLGVDFATFDAAVNSGPSRAAKWLQKGINKVAGRAVLSVDRDIGTATIAAAHDYSAIAIINASLDYRLGFMKIARNSKTGKPLWPSFGRGWANRLFGYLPAGKAVRQANGVDDVAAAMANGQALKPKPAPDPKTPHAPPTDMSPPVALIAIIIALIIGAWQWLTRSKN